MSEVYVLTSGDYDDYGINDVFTDKDAAEAARDAHNFVHKYNESRVETYEVDNVVPTTCWWFRANAAWSEAEGFSLDWDAQEHRAFGVPPEFKGDYEVQTVKGSKHAGVGKNDDGSWKHYRKVHASGDDSTPDGARDLALMALRAGLAAANIAVEWPVES